jgi:succinate dehydrogenase/fumarate reductase cytochrome b subunit
MGTAAASNAGSTRLLLAGALGALVALTLGIYGNAHDPASDLAITLGFKDTITMKVWLASGAALLACVQAGSALWIYKGRPPAWAGSLHRISGRLAFLLTLPVAYHCLYQLAFQDTSTRVLVHSILGCAFYGAFAAKVVIVRSPKLPGIALPIAGGLTFSILIGIWLTSALWFINENGFPSP